MDKKGSIEATITFRGGEKITVSNMDASGKVIDIDIVKEVERVKKEHKDKQDIIDSGKIKI